MVTLALRRVVVPSVEGSCNRTTANAPLVRKVDGVGMRRHLLYRHDVCECERHDGLDLRFWRGGNEEENQGEGNEEEKVRIMQYMLTSRFV